MWSSARPHFQSSLKQLREIFESHQNDITLLRILAGELQYRTTPPALALRQQVQTRLDRLHRQPTHSQGSDAVVDSPPGAAVQHDFWPRDTGSSGTTGEGPRARPDAPFDDRLRRPPRYKRIEPLGVSGRPPKFVRPLRTDVALDFAPGMSRAARYALALGALIADMHQQRQSRTQIILEGGERTPLDRHHIGYSFAFPEDAELFEEARVELHIGARTIEGQIASISGGRIVIAVVDDLGPNISRCVLIIDNTALLEALKERLEKVGAEGRRINTALADDAVSNHGEPAPRASPPASAAFTKLTSRQREAVRLALSNQVVYIWGPPGTGKTRTLSVLIHELFDAGKRTLICSNTNRAVDQVLLSLCRTLGIAHPAMEEGKIVRLGRVAHEQLRDKYAEFVTLDGIVARRSRDLQQRKAALESQIAANARRSERVEALLRHFTEFDRARDGYSEQEAETARLATEGKAAVHRRDDANRRLGELSLEIEALRKAGGLRRIFLRSETTISTDILRAKEAIAGADADAARLLDLHRQARAKRDTFAARRDGLAQALASVDRAGLTTQMEALNAERQPLLNELAVINKALADIEASVMREAAVIGATVTKAYLSAKDLPNFDVVVIDEASMVLLPALYYAIGLAKDKVVISGDFRQLPPIVPTEQKAILDEIGKDVFHAARIVASVEADQGHSRLVMLDEQHRMHESICGLISGPMYRGKLRTADAVNARPAQVRDPVTGPLTIIDTSALWPFETQTLSFSRYNLVHALVVRNLFLRLAEAGHIGGTGELGICTPYAAQAKLIRRLIEDEDLTGVIDAGTIHRYQGDQKTTIVIDIPESVGGGRFIGGFLQGDHPDDDGTKLINVAVSRAQEHLVCVANLTYLDDRLPGSAFLRHILFRMQSSGNVIDAREILTLRPADLRGIGRPVDIDLETQRTGLFGGRDFDTVFRVDVAHALTSILIFSGFVTPERVGAYGDLFRRKILEGVKIRCVTRPPSFNGSVPVHDGKSALDSLENIGVIIDCRRDIHQKIAMIDGRTVWFGSLNPLSHTARTDETMMRVLAPQFASELARQVALRSAGRDGADSGLHGENPRCGRCGGRSYYFFSSRKRRSFFACEDSCGWLQDADSAMSGRQRRAGSDNARRQRPH
jgi:hypothetical protein